MTIVQMEIVWTAHANQQPAVIMSKMVKKPIWIVVVRPAQGVLQPPAASSHEIVRARSVRTASVKTRPVMTMS